MPSLPKKKQNKQYSAPINGKAYHTRAWRKLRAQYIRLNPLCVHCLERHTLTDCTAKGAGVVDHIKPISEGGELLDPNNLQTLCTTCHAIKTGREVAKRYGRSKTK